MNHRGIMATSFLPGLTQNAGDARYPKKSGFEPITVADAAARRNPASYPDGVVVGITEVVQADEPNKTYYPIAADVTLPASWRYKIDGADGEDLTVSMELADVSDLVPDPHVLARNGSGPSLGTGNKEGGLNFLMDTLPAGYIRLITTRVPFGIGVLMNADGTAANAVAYAPTGDNAVTNKTAVSHSRPFAPTEWIIWPCIDNAGVPGSGPLGKITSIIISDVSFIDLSSAADIETLRLDVYAGVYLDLAMTSSLTALTITSALNLEFLNAAHIAQNSGLEVLRLVDIPNLTGVLDLSGMPLSGGGNNTDIQRTNLSEVNITGAGLLSLGDGLVSAGNKGLSLSEVIVALGGNSSMNGIYIQNSTAKHTFQGTTPYANYGGYNGYAAFDLRNSPWVTTDALYESLVGMVKDQGALDLGQLILTGCPCLGGGVDIVDGATYTAAQVEAVITAAGLYY